MEIRINIDDNDAIRILNALKVAVGSEKSEQVTAAESVAEEPAEKKYVQEEVKDYSFTEVRTLLTEKSREGFTNEVKELVRKYGSGKLSGVNPANYADLLLEAQFRCREPFTREEVAARVEELKAEGHSDSLASLFEYHNATSIEDLREEYYASFMRDAWRIDHARK